MHARGGARAARRPPGSEVARTASRGSGGGDRGETPLRSGCAPLGVRRGSGVERGYGPRKLREPPFPAASRVTRAKPHRGIVRGSWGKARRGWQTMSETVRIGANGARFRRARGPGGSKEARKRGPKKGTGPRKGEADKRTSTRKSIERGFSRRGGRGAGVEGRSERGAGSAQAPRSRTGRAGARRKEGGRTALCVRERKTRGAPPSVGPWPRLKSPLSVPPGNLSYVEPRGRPRAAPGAPRPSSTGARSRTWRPDSFFMGSFGGREDRTGAILEARRVNREKPYGKGEEPDGASK